jgi:hypothetical protein
MISTCKAVYVRGPRKGQVCGKDCKGRKCPVHTDKCKEYRTIVGTTRKYDTLVEKTNDLLDSSNEVLNVLEKDKDTIERKLYGVRIYLRDNSLVKIKNYNYIQYEHNTKQNAILKKKTMVKKRGTIIGEIEDIKRKIEILERVKNIYNENNV